MMILNPYRYASAALWTPASLAAPPAAWYNETSSITSSGSNLTGWSDISGNGLDLSVNSTPTINASGLDSRRTISFDGSNDAAYNASAAGKAIFKNTAAAWALILYKTTDATAVIRSLFYASTNTTSAARFNICSSTTSATRKPALRARRLDADSIATLNGTAATDTNWHAILCTMDYSAGDGTLYLDGTQDAQNLSLTTSGSTSNTDSTEGFSLGATPSGGSASAAEIAEAVVGHGSLPTSMEVDKLFGYVLWRWGLQANLPGGHPYHGGPP